VKRPSVPAGYWFGGSFDGCFSRLRRELLSSCFAKKKVTKEEGDPGRRPAARGTLRYSVWAGAAELGPAGLKQSSPLFRPNLRCSASHKGPGKASRHHLRGQNWRMSVFCCCLNDVSTGRFSLARRQRRATEALAERGRGLSEGRSPEFRSALSDAQHREEVLLGCPRQRRVAQGTGEAGADVGSPFLCLLSFGEAKESKARRKRENQRLQEGYPQKPWSDPGLRSRVLRVLQAKPKAMGATP
jgi:hypothetical protein